MSNDASYHEGGTEQTHKKLCQTKLLNPLERWKTLGTDWMGVICELEGVVLSDLSPSHRAALLDARRDQIAFVQRGDRISALLWRRKL